MTASLSGDIVAQRCVGEKLLAGEDGFGVDPEKARRYLARAALAGDAQAQYRLALCCDQGIGGK
jgi:TPR repeat protein